MMSCSVSEDTYVHNYTKALLLTSHENLQPHLRWLSRHRQDSK
jgi:hypothetical protein